MVAQAVIGGIVVLTKLNPAAVSVHFLVSASIVAAAVALHSAVSGGRPPAAPRSSPSPSSPPPPPPPRPPGRDPSPQTPLGRDPSPQTPLGRDPYPQTPLGAVARPTPVRRDLQLISAALVAVTCVMLAVGTVVTGTGPLACHADAPRYKLPLEGVTQLHADIGWLMAGLAVALVLGLRLSGAPPRAVRAAGWIMLAALGLQGVIGYVQYFAHLRRAGMGPRDRFRAGLDRRAAAVLRGARAKPAAGRAT